MPNYKLNIDFSDEALRTIYAAGQKLALVKTVTGDAGQQVTWVATLPFQTNVIEWKNEYMLYAAGHEASNGATIKKLSEVETTDDGCIYDFIDGTFGNAHTDPAVQRNTYGARNEMNQYPYLTVGMAVSATVNGEMKKGNPINAVDLPYNHTAVMSPIESVGIFLATDIDDGMVLTREFGNSLTVEYRGSETEHSVRYDDTSGIFVIAD